MKKFIFTCPVQGCDYKVHVEANVEDEAVEKLTQPVSAHGAQMHSGMQLSEEKAKEILRSNIKVEQNI